MCVGYILQEVKMLFDVYLKCYMLEVVLSYSKALIVHVPVSTPDIGHKDLNLNGANLMNYITDMKSYGMEAEPINSLKLTVKSCADTSVYIYDSEEATGMTGLYNFFIGASGNTWTAIYKFTSSSGNSQKTFVYDSVLTCPNFISLWFSWNGGIISYGRGTSVNENIILTWTDVTPIDIRGVGLSTAFQQTGEWKVITSISDRFTGFFSKCGRTNTRASLDFLGSLRVPLTTCAAACRMNSVCLGFNFHKQDKQCELLTVTGGVVEDIPLTSDFGWDYYTKCYQEKEVCIGCFFKSI